MKHIETCIDINAPVARVWAALTDFEAYPEWNPRSRITGVAAPGERLVVAPGPDAEGMQSFPGLLAGLLLRRYGADTEAGFQAVNEALKTRSETLTATADADSVAA